MNSLPAELSGKPIVLYHNRFLVLLLKACVRSGCSRRTMVETITQKPISRPCWWKGKFALFQMMATGGPGVGGGRLSKSWLLPDWQPLGQELLLTKWGGGGTCRNSTTNSDTHLQIGIGGLSNIILVALGAVNLQFQRRQWHPTPELLPGKSHGRRSLVGCSPWGRL